VVWCGRFFEQPGVGKASVNHHSQIARVLGILLSVELVPQSGNPLESDKVNVGGGQLSLIKAVLSGRRMASRSSGQRSLLEINWYHAAESILASDQG
jgi:hypothetical protein